MGILNRFLRLHQLVMVLMGFQHGAMIQVVTRRLGTAVAVSFTLSHA